MGKLIIVSNRLPVKIDTNGNVSRTTGGLTSALEGANLQVEQLWVGWPGSTDQCQDLDKATTKLQQSGFYPVFLSKDQVDGYYEGYSNATLWPVLHYMVERAEFKNEWWETYQEVNRKFAETIVKIAKPGDIVWIHDYHFFLLPSMIRSMSMDGGLRIGFFLHIPFCSSEIFRVVPQREELLRGLLGADLIGFQAFSYLRHFRSSLLRVLGLETEIFGLRQDGRTIKMEAYPIGHNLLGFQKIINDESFGETVRKQQEALAGKRMILNVERLDYTKGVVEKLAAIRRFFELHPDKVEEVVFVLIAVPTRQGVKEYDNLTERVQREVGAINGKFGQVGHMPVQFFHRGFPMEELAAFYTLAEVCMVTPLRDGMNLVAKEFLSCTGTKFTEKPGVLILSEFAGAANELSEAIHVNPYDVDATAMAINTALDLPSAERLQRCVRMQALLGKADSAAWARRFMGDLQRTGKRKMSFHIQDLAHLSRSIVDKIGKGKQIGLFLDYDGTLRDFVDVPDQAVPDDKLKKLLKEMAGHESISIALVSGRPAEFLEKHFGGLGVTLVAEHGYRWLEGGQGEWQLVNPNVNIDWKEAIRDHLGRVAFATPGAHVEEKLTSIVWHYRKADPEYGKWRANDLLEELTHMVANLPVTVHHGQKIVEVSSMQVNKGEAVSHLLNHMNCDVAVVAGDDQTDETMISLQPQDVEFHAIKVGRGETSAMYRTDIPGMRTFLEKIHSSTPRSNQLEALHNKENNQKSDKEHFQ